MSLMIVKVSSSTSFHQNKKLQSNKANERNQTVADSGGTVLLIDAAHKPSPPPPGATGFSPPLILPQRIPHHKNRPHGKIVHEIHDNHDNGQQRQHQQQISRAISGETAYLLERIDHKQPGQPIYGTWLTKTKRPQPPLVETEESATSINANVVGNSAGRFLSGASDLIDNITEQFEHRDGHLLRRSATMTPTQSELRDQLPRPPSHIVSRQPSMLRRLPAETEESRYNEIDREYSQPKPFHFPQEGPLPQQFSKFHPMPEPERSSELNNIQDILKKLQLGGIQTKASPPPPQLPPSAPPQPMIVMPTGLHVAGSFKNFKSSGIANFFRNKRYKKHLQLAVPMHYMGGYQPPLMPVFAPHQRIAMDQLYSFKPRSPNEINLLAMQQQLKSSSRSRNKKKHQQQVVAMVASPSLILPPHTNQRPYPADPFLQQTYHPHYMFALNQSQKSKPKRIPFKLNLDIYPVATPTQDYKASAFTLEEAKISTTVRPASVLQNSFGDYYPFPPAPASVSTVPYGAAADNLAYNTLNFQPFHGGKPQLTELPKSSNTVYALNTNSNPFYGNLLHHQHHQQQQLQVLRPYSVSNQPNTNYYNSVDQLQPLESGSGSAANPNSNSNQLLLHLNVFPKQPPLASSSTNPFYNNNIGNDSRNIMSPQSINRQSIDDQPAALSHPETSPELISPKVKPRCNKNANRTMGTMSHSNIIARSDNSESSTHGLIDFEHPIVAAEIPTAQPLVALRSDDQGLNTNVTNIENGQPLVDSIVGNLNAQQESRANFRYMNVSANNIDHQMISEALAASLFRFPVEDLIKFQANDAL